MPDKQQQQQPKTASTAGEGLVTTRPSGGMTQGDVTATAGAGGSSPANGQQAGGQAADQDQGEGQTMTAYERLTAELFTDQRLLKEVTLGRRIGFYKIRGELGCGNFSQVKMGVHNLTRGE
jgi:hypothetical protein